MKIDELIKELGTDEKLYKLVLLYLLVKEKEKDYLLELYKKGNDSNVCVAIKNAVFEDKETMDTIQSIIEGENLGKGDIPSFEKTSEIIKKQMLPLDHEDSKAFIKNNKR